jgi:hypothetical protein
MSLDKLSKESKMRLRSVFLPIAVVLAVAVSLGLPVETCSAAVQATFYLAPDGSDDNPGTEAKPLATIEKAKQAVRASNKDTTGDILVVLRGGTYTLDRTLVFDAADSGNGGNKVIYRAAKNETPVISGGRRITGWQPDEKGRWKAPATVANFRQLYVDGKRAIRARGEKPAGLEFVGDDAYRTSAVEMADWKNPSDIEFSYVVIWANTRCKVQSIKREGDHAIITMLEPHFGNAKAKEGVNIANADQVASVWIENALELLDQPGEWYLDQPAKTVYYMPRPGEEARTCPRPK